MNDVMVDWKDVPKTTELPPLEEIDLDDVLRDHGAAIRARVLRAVDHVEGELANVIVLVADARTFVMSFEGFTRYAARAAKVDGAKLVEQLRAMPGPRGDRVVVASAKPDGRGWTFMAVAVPRVSLEGITR